MKFQRIIKGLIVVGFLAFTCFVGSFLSFLNGEELQKGLLLTLALSGAITIVTIIFLGLFDHWQEKAVQKAVFYVARYADAVTQQTQNASMMTKKEIGNIVDQSRSLQGVASSISNISLTMVENEQEMHKLQELAQVNSECLEREREDMRDIQISAGQMNQVSQKLGEALQLIEDTAMRISGVARSNEMPSDDASPDDLKGLAVSLTETVRLCSMLVKDNKEKSQKHLEVSETVYTEMERVADQTKQFSQNVNSIAQRSSQQAEDISHMINDLEKLTEEIKQSMIREQKNLKISNVFAENMGSLGGLIERLACRMGAKVTHNALEAPEWQGPERRKKIGDAVHKEIGHAGFKDGSGKHIEEYFDSLFNTKRS